MIGKYKIVTLCGSTRFKDMFYQVQKELTLQECIVISVGLFGHAGDEEVWENMDEGTLTRTKEMLDDMHKRKIDLADEIFVINVGGYIGDSTRSEIAYAKEHGKPVRYLEEPGDETAETVPESEITWMVLQASVFLYGSIQIVADRYPDRVVVSCTQSADGQNERKEKEWIAEREAFQRMLENIKDWTVQNRELLQETGEPNAYAVKEEQERGLNGWVLALGDKEDRRLLFLEGNSFTSKAVEEVFGIIRNAFPGTEGFLEL